MKLEAYLAGDTRGMAQVQTQLDAFQQFSWMSLQKEGRNENTCGVPNAGRRDITRMNAQYSHSI
jgi:hypothetical protein